MKIVNYTLSSLAFDGKSNIEKYIYIYIENYELDFRLNFS